MKFKRLKYRSGRNHGTRYFNVDRIEWIEELKNDNDGFKSIFIIDGEIYKVKINPKQLLNDNKKEIK